MKYSGMILAAGFGKRMHPLTKDIPKPLISIKGVSLLDNAINFLKHIGCNQIIVNTHYKHQKIIKHIENRKDSSSIKIIYEENILDTGGAIKNALPFISYKNLVIINSDIFWRKENIKDAKLLIKSYSKKKEPHLLLVKKINAFGLNKNLGDFNLYKNNVIRFKKGKEIIYYSGLQMLNPALFSLFIKKKFSFNEVWNFLIKEKKLFGNIMQTEWYHVGDMQGLNIAKKLDP